MRAQAAPCTQQGSAGGMRAPHSPPLPLPPPPPPPQLTKLPACCMHRAGSVPAPAAMEAAVLRDPWMRSRERLRSEIFQVWQLHAT